MVRLKFRKYQVILAEKREIIAKNRSSIYVTNECVVEKCDSSVVEVKASNLFSNIGQTNQKNVEVIIDNTSSESNGVLETALWSSYDGDIESRNIVCS